MSAAVLDFPARESLVALWHRHKGELPALGRIMRSARAGEMPGIAPAKHGYTVTDEAAALAAMRKVT